MEEKEYQKQYQKENLKLYSFRLNKNNLHEKELIRYLNSKDNKRRWIIETLVHQMIEEVTTYWREKNERGEQTDKDD